ncbi:MAG: hypothetical protein J1F35_02710 [Erysipelotrichales bacterium]|nr:hypothetical protein [Erysipelotrichales bacterium]
MKKNVYLVVTVIAVLLLLVILIISKKDTFSVIELDNGDILKKVETSGASILYTKELNNSIEERLESYYKEFRISAYYSVMDLESINNMLADYELSTESDAVFIIFMNGEPVDVVSTVDNNRVVELLNKHLYNIIPESEISYKVLSKANQYIKKVNSKDYTVAVFGIDNCTYCDLYLPVVNDIANKYNLDIYYFNRDQYDEDEYEKIMDLDFEIPAKCTTTGYSTSMTKSFPKPMTIITKNGKFVDCIRGYVTEDTVLDMLREYKIVKE